jgi:hypothetical protein
MCVVYLVFLITKIPETKGKSLEDLERILTKEYSTGPRGLVWAGR